MCVEVNHLPHTFYSLGEHTTTNIKMTATILRLFKVNRKRSNKKKYFLYIN